MEIRFLCTLLTLFVLEYVALCEAQKEGDPHVCIKNIPHKVSITKTVKCRRGTCRKTVERYQLAPTPVCCEGWIYSAENSECKPDCTHGCVRGKCIEPNTCACDAPLILKNNNTCTEPLCDPPCVNADCVDDDRCLCKEGYTTFNSTHCAPKCSDGFINDPDTLQCIPHCDIPCTHGTCSAPNTCTCNEGYELKDNSCVPRCSEPCLNGACMAPDTCQCNTGYNIDSSNKYRCLPACDKECTNATCDAPNVCVCLAGYEPVVDDLWACKPQCDQCDNGECVAPNECRCFDGYSKLNETCQPVCSEPCSNGVCSAPNKCTCNNGYEPDSENPFTCKPICKEKCIHGDCVSPDTCECKSGYEKINNTCTPTCRSCKNGVCVSPDNCQCHKGYEMKNGICEAVCSTACINGFCEFPEKCACNEGYVKKLIDQYTCYKPCKSCDGNCTIDGECKSEYKLLKNPCITPVERTVQITKLGKCGKRPCTKTVSKRQMTCCEGWTYSSKDKECKPDCTDGCVRGTCIEPNTCACDPPLILKNNNTCIEPLCDPPCVNAECVDDDKCLCNEGYTTINSTHCAPKCSDGFINDPETLKCNPKCDVPCINGICTAPNTCTCNEGYVKNITDQYACYKACESCGFGNCTADGECLCGPGYKLFKDSCIIPTNCSNCSSTCTEGECRCEDGRPCFHPLNDSAEAASATRLAGLQLTWLLGGCVGILLIAVVIINIGYLWRKRRDYGAKSPNLGNAYGSVVFTMPDTLMRRNYGDAQPDAINEEDEEDARTEVSHQLLGETEDAHEEDIDLQKRNDK